MAVEVLLRKSIESLGKVGEVVRVRNGYARNFLLPQGLAVSPTAENLRLVEKDKVVEAAVEAERAKERADLMAKLEGVSITLEAKANPEGHLFGSVGPKQIADALVAKGFPVAERNVRIEPLKALGEYEVLVHLAADAEPTIKVWIVEEISGEQPPSQRGEKPTETGAKAERSAAAAAEKPAKGEKPAAKAEKAPAKAEKAEKPSKAEKPAKGEKPGKG
jgi:large subunit ribosomal protein L9